VSHRKHRRDSRSLPGKSAVYKIGMDADLVEGI